MVSPSYTTFTHLHLQDLFMAAPTKSAGLTKPSILIIVVASAERFAYKGVVSNLVTYLTDVVSLSTSSAAKNVNAWCGVTSILPLLGAFLADSYWDRYSAIFYSSLLYVLGLGSLTIWALLFASPHHINETIFTIALFGSLYLISIAQGGYNPCLQAFGAEQLDNSGHDLPAVGVVISSDQEEDNEKKKGKFFQWWYFGICAGSLLGVMVMSYIQDNYGWGWGFAIPTAAMAIASVCFSCGTPLYTRKPLKRMDKPLEELLQALKAAVKRVVCKRIKLLPHDHEAELELQDKPLKENCIDINTTDKASMILASDSPLQVVWRLVPVWALLLMFAVIFQLPATFFTRQGMSMKRNIGKNFVIPPATLQSAITISIIILMPLYDKLIIPALRLVTRTKKGINVMQRMGIGMFLSMAAMVIAALVESKRLELSRRSDGERTQLSIFCLLPQYILLGVSDVFTVVGMQEFFYSQVPPEMRSIGIGLYLSVFGVGSFVSAFLITIIETITSSIGRGQSWFSDDMTQARLDNYYWFLAVSSSVSFFLFLSVAPRFSSKNKMGLSP